MSTEENRKSPATLIVGLVIVVAGVGLLGKNAYDVYRGASSKSWPSVKGTVQTSKVKRIDRVRKADRFEADVRYAYEVAGKAYGSSRIRYGEHQGFRGEAESLVAKYPRGSEVNVFYEPGAPEEAVLETVISISVFAMLLGPLIVLFGLYLLRNGFHQMRGAA